MGRIITQERRQQIAAARAANPDALGPALAEQIINGNVPVEIVSQLLAVSEPTVYRWMYGNSEPRDHDKIQKVKKLLVIMRKGRRGKDLPLSGGTKDRNEAFLKVVAKYRTPAA